MKVLFINSVYGRGSTGRIVKDLGEALEKQGHSYMVAYGRGEKLADPHCYFIGSKASVYFHAAMSRLTDRAGFYSKAATKKLVRFIGEYAPDVIHLHNLHGYYLNIEILFDYLKTQYKGKVIWTLHDCWAFTGHCVHFTCAGCQKWKTGCGRCPESRRYPVSLLADASARNYVQKKNLLQGLKNLTIVTPSQWLDDQVAASYLNQYPCYVIHNGIDLNVFCPQNVEKDEKLLLNVADGLDSRKGFWDLVKLMDYLPKDYKLYIVGVNKRDLLKIPKSITPVLRTNSVLELAEYYSRAAWLINLTYEDTFPTVNIEALACGTPVITYASGGSPEIIDENCGYTIASGDVEAVAACILRNKRPDVNACEKRAVFFHGAEKFLQYLELYCKLCGGR